jgi:kumamolisin
VPKSSSERTWVELAGSEKGLSAGSKTGAPTPPDEVFSVLIRLRRQRPLPALTGKAGSKHLTHAAYAAKHSARAGDINKVKLFAKRFGLAVDEVAPVERSVVLKGTAAQFSKAFRVELKTHKLANGASYRGREGKIFIPATLQGVVVGVFGLDERPVVFSHVRRGPLTAAHHAAAAQQFQTPGSIKPFYGKQLATLYNFPAGVDGSGQTIGLVEIGGGFRQVDLDNYFKQAGISKAPNISVATVPHGGSNSPQPSNKDLPDVEVLLDMEVAGSAAPGAKLVMYFGKDGSPKQTLLAVQAAVHDQSANPTVLSLSWGGKEYDKSLGGGTQGAMEQQYQDNLNDLFQTAGTLGITVCVSSGDNASACAPVDDPQMPWDGHAHVSFPASSPLVLAVGGTHIVNDAVKPMKEETWHPGPNAGTGGGISRFFPRPAYQQNAVTQTAVNPAGGTGRGVPDVSADAAQESGYIVVVDGESFPGSGRNPPVGGTSAACPLWAALIARLNQSLHTKLGFVNTRLYQVHAAAAALNDITQGNNGDYHAGPGWDACTGLGTPNGENLLTALTHMVAPGAAASIAARVAASAARKPLRNRGRVARPTPEQISGEVSRRITEFDSGDPSTYFAGAIASPQVSKAGALSPIAWPSGKAPMPAPPATAPDPDAPLSNFDYLIVTWTVAEAQALADVLTPGYPSQTAWYHYTHNFTSQFVPLINPEAPAVKDSHRLGSFFPTTIGGKRVLCFKSELHFNQDGPKLPILKLWKQLIAEVNPKLVITTGTAGGIGSFVELGDVVVAPAVRFDCTTKFKSQSFAKSVYACSKLVQTSLAVAQPLFAANAAQLPAANRLPSIITQAGPEVASADVVTTDFFAYDDVLDTYGLQGLGSACDEGDAALGLVIQQLGKSAPKWAAVRNASDPQISDAGMTSKQGYELATSYYSRYGYWTTIPSAITCWALVLDN